MRGTVVNNGTSVKLALVCAGAMAFAGCICADTAKIGVLVLDGVTDAPIPNVKVEGCFNMDYGWEAFKGSPGSNTAEATTDARGRCKLRGKTNVGAAAAGVSVAPPGYYSNFAGGGYDYKSKNVFGVWQPDNLVVTIRLQRVENPIPLFVKQVGDKRSHGGWRRTFPGKEPGEKIAYDMLVGDWLPPVGTGAVADVVFERLPRQSLGEAVTARGEKKEAYRETMSVTFPGADNGLVEVPVNRGHRLKIRQAPESGYLPRRETWYEVDKNWNEHKSYDENRCFCFRIRTKRNEKGEIVSAHYGKIYGDVFFSLQIQPERVVVAVPSMRYYLNQTPMDRNLEWNMVNLCNSQEWLSSPQP